MTTVALTDIQDLLHHASRLRGNDRRKFLDSSFAAAPDALVGRRREIERLLDALDSCGEFLVRPALAPELEPAAGALDPQVCDDLAERGFRPIEQIGEGGMGVVYRAEQLRPLRRTVAPKLVKPGMNLRHVLARFEAERQALARMNHPNVAGVYDAGTTRAGRPYFVMEYVPGQPITRYCDQHALTVRERLKLFAQACEAVQHAHQKGIIHRDLKPGNILVATGGEGHAPTVKVIDFGIAKAIATDGSDAPTAVTGSGQMIGTLEYMSPEQADAGEAGIDTRTDVYALGVVLYDLLCGATPFDANALRQAAMAGEVARLVRNVEPKAPSARLMGFAPEVASGAARARGETDARRLFRTVRGDLDWITLRSLEKDRDRRYPTTHDLAADLKRYMSDEPVVAAAPSRLYRFGKFVRRNRAGVVAVSLVLLALVLGTAGTTIGMLRASAARAQAEHDRDAARAADAISQQVTKFLADAILAADPEHGGDAELPMREVVVRAAKALDGRFQDQPLVEAKIRDVIGETLLGIRAYTPAEPQIRRALELRRKFLGADHPDTLDSLANLGGIMLERGQLADAETIFRELLDRRRRVLPPDHQDVIAAMGNLSITLSEMGRSAEAMDVDCQALDARRRTLGPTHPRTLLTAHNLAGSLYRAGRKVEGVQMLREIIDASPKAPGGQDAPRTMQSVLNLAQMLSEMGRFDEIEPLARRAIAGAEHSFGPLNGPMAQACELLGDALAHTGRPHEAVEQYLRARDVASKLTRPEPKQIERLQAKIRDVDPHALPTTTRSATTSAAP